LGDFDALRHRLHFGHAQASLSVTLNLGDFDALRHRLHFGHAQASLSVTLNLGDFHHFCAYALVGATRQ
jgi:hypothetical protein